MFIVWFNLVPMLPIPFGFGSPLFTCWNSYGGILGLLVARS
jgi:hypothetical protein